ncbi:MAG TPA: alpha/beta hydrolase [Acidimicrobiia bacterium]|nr:alpha/beta hydrolase [Acidimicrobiia bacterium]
MHSTSGETASGPFTMRWREEGPDLDPTRQVLLLHGLYAGAHSFEWRRLVPILAQRFRVRVPDILGSATSDRPDLDYTRAIVQSAVEELIGDMESDAIVVGSSLTGAYALAAIARQPVRRPLLLITPSGMGRSRERQPSGVNRVLYALARHTPVGDAFVDALTSEPSVRWFQTHKTYQEPSFFTAEEAIATRRAGRLPNAKHLQLAFVFNRLSLDVSSIDVERVRPTVLWACGQDFVDNAERLAWQHSGATVVEVDSGLPQVEEPETVAQLLASMASDASS